MLAACGLAAGVASASGGHPTATQAPAVSLTYRCHFPAGQHPLTVGVTARLPAVAKVGKPIQPTGVALAMSLPPATSSALASLHSATVNAVTRLTVSESEGPVGTSAVWPGITAHPVHRPAVGGLTLTAAGQVPSVTASSPGNVALTAAGLSVSFSAGQAAAPAPGPAQPTASAAGTVNVPAPATPSAGGGTPVPSPSAAARPPLLVACTLAPGQQAALGTVVVTGKARQVIRQAGTPVGKCPKLPPGGLKLNPRFPAPPHPKLTIDAHSPAQGCAFATGYADVRKLKGATLLQPVITNVWETINTLANTTPQVNYLQLDNAAELEFQGKHQFPPSTATFLTFGFVPTTATLDLMEQGTINIFVVGPALPGTPCHPNKFRTCDNVATAYSRLKALIAPGSVKVNGVPLDVGSHCETPPFDVILTGSNATNPPYSIQFGGPLTGMATIPHFKNCGVGENLDPIFNAAISGPRNFTILTQGPLCTVQGAFGCVPKTGTPFPVKPIRKVTG